MMKNIILETIMFLSLFLVNVSLSFAKDIEMITIYITAENDQPPTDSAGLIFFSDHVEEITNCNLQEIGTNKYLVSFQIPKQKYKRSEFFNAILLNGSNSPTFGIMRSPETATYDGTLDSCPMKDPSQALKSNQDFNVYKRIIKLKNDRVESEKKVFLDTLDPMTEKNLRILSEKLGIYHSKDFSELKNEPLELVYQLSKLEEALKVYLATPSTKQK